MTASRHGYPISRMRIKFEPDIVTARQKTRRLAQLLGFAGQDRARLSTAVSELARNVFQYAAGGTIEFLFSDTPPQQVFVRVSDTGPGISSLETILNGTYVSKTGMGVGLNGAKKLMDSFEIDTRAGVGTVVVIGKILGKHTRVIAKEELPSIATELNSPTSDSAFEEIQNQNRDLLDALEDARIARHELTSLNSKLQVAYEDAASANHAKTRFLANMSHEIRTPLGVILGFADLAMDPQATVSDRHGYLSTIKRSATSLTNLIGEILDLSKIEAGKIEIETIEFSLPELLHEAVQALGAQAKEKGIKLSLKIVGEFPDLVRSDPTRLRQILINLINNAVKFTQRGAVDISVLSHGADASRASSTIEISVIDSGIGIPADRQAKLFEAFTQADSSTTRKFGGTGLGLNLSKHLAEALGGTLFLLSSRQNIGSTFCINLDVGISDQTVFAEYREPDRQLSDVVSAYRPRNELLGMRILLVEDSADNQFLFERYLLKAGAKVEIASDGVEGVAKARAQSFNAILMDVQMPNLDGYGATKQIRELGIHTPIIALTAHAMKEEREAALNSGFTGYLIKPLNPELLIETLAPYRL